MPRPVMRINLRLGTRPSPLAFKQAAEIQNIFAHVQFQVVPIYTRGDKDRKTPLSEVEGSDFFTREIDQALLEGKIDLAVHSSKDLPEVLAKGLSIALETESLTPFDALVSRNYLQFNALPAGWRIGVSSKRRKDQIKALRADLEIIDVRGNIEERIELIQKDKIDALIVAHAALIRLGLESQIAQILPLSIFKPHPKQGSLSLLTREENWQEVKSILLAQAPAIGS